MLNGATITEISKKTGFSRNTISKYVSILELKKKIFSKKIGMFRLYFSTEQNYPKIFGISYYKAILAGLKKYYPNDYETFKKIGKECFEYIDFSFERAIFKDFEHLRPNKFIFLFMDVFGKLYPSIDVVDPIIDTYMKEDESGRKIVLKFKSKEYLANTEDYIYHFYIIAGIAEAIYKRELNLNIICNVENVHLSDKVGESFVELSMKIE
jgi:DNA polymerase elongation subunit (family B)